LDEGRKSSENRGENSTLPRAKKIPETGPRREKLGGRYRHVPGTFLARSWRVPSRS